MFLDDSMLDRMGQLKMLSLQLVPFHADVTSLCGLMPANARGKPYPRRPTSGALPMDSCQYSSTHLLLVSLHTPCTPICRICHAPLTYIDTPHGHAMLARHAYTSCAYRVHPCMYHVRTVCTHACTMCDPCTLQVHLRPMRTLHPTCVLPYLPCAAP